MTAAFLDLIASRLRGSEAGEHYAARLSAIKLAAIFAARGDAIVRRCVVDHCVENGLMECDPVEFLPSLAQVISEALTL